MVIPLRLSLLVVVLNALGSSALVASDARPSMEPRIDLRKPPYTRVLRPPPSSRRFRSEAVDKYIANLTSRLADPVVATMFAQCYPNTLDTTVDYTAGPPSDTFVITGDIDAMWLRDSTNQVLPYVRFATADAHLASMLQGLVRRQAACVLTDPYANAFNKNPAPPNSDHTTDHSQTAQNPLVHERKFEIDSLCAFLKLLNRYYSVTTDASLVAEPSVVKAIETVARVFKERQLPQQYEYTFTRLTTVPTDTLEKGVGGRFRVTGMLATPFRPSDDATTHMYLVPANAMAVVELRRTVPLMHMIDRIDLADELKTLADQIDAGIKTHGVIRRAGRQVYAYEVDGFGNALFMDDANVPSLLSLPYLGYLNHSDPIYRDTRQLLLNATTNPFYFTGRYSGIGSPHTDTNYIWPMALAVRILTSTDETEVKQLLQELVSTTAGTNFMHESFDANDPTHYSRPWFAWANSLFGETVIQLVERYPHWMLKQ